MIGFLALNEGLLELAQGGYPPAMAVKNALDPNRTTDEDTLMRSIAWFLQSPFANDPRGHTCMTCEQVLLCKDAWNRESVHGYCHVHESTAPYTPNRTAAE